MQQTQAQILCPLCNLPFYAKANCNICQKCLNQQPAEPLIPEQEIHIQFCKLCARYENNGHWAAMNRESKQLLSIILKRIRGIQGCKIMEANFVFTDPSTKLFKIKIEIQKTIENNTTIQTTIIQAHEDYSQCNDCKKEFTPHTWIGKVQLRQKVKHKHTLEQLEQKITKDWVPKMTEIEQSPDGLDINFRTRQVMLEFNSWIAQTFICKMIHSQQLISNDLNNNISHYKYTTSVELAKVTKHDLLLLPPHTRKSLAVSSSLLLVSKIASNITLIDPANLRENVITSEKYYSIESQMESLQFKTYQQEFTVIDIEAKTNKTKEKETKWNYLTLLDSQNNEVNSKTLILNLYVGDTVLGYDLRQITFSMIDEVKGDLEVIVVKKKTH